MSVTFRFLSILFIVFIFNKNTFSQSNTTIDSLLNVLPSVKNDSAKAEINDQLAKLYYDLSSYKESIKYNLKAYSLYEKLKNKTGQSNAYSQIGVVYYRLKNWNKAIDYLTQALDIAINANDSIGQGRFLNNLGTVYEKKKDYENALKYHYKALKLKQQFSDSLSISKSLSNIGNIYYHKKDYEEAINYYKRSLAIKLKTNDYVGLSNVHQNIGYTYYQNGDYNKALEYVKKGLDYALKANNLYFEIQAYANLADIYRSTKDYKNAYESLSINKRLSDSLDQINNTKLIAEMDAKFEAAKKDNEIALQKIEKDKLNTELKLQSTQKIWFAIGLILAIILFFVAFRAYKQKQKTNFLLAEKNTIIEEKNKNITDSINYASNIQKSILPSENLIANALTEHFIFYQPKDIVSGDFYWFHEKETLTFIMAADCTGHGVPGAFVSMLCNNALNQVIIENDVNDPGKILSQVNNKIITSLRKNNSLYTISDGMDCSLCVIDKSNNKINFSGAYNNLVSVNNGKINELKADRTPIGGRTKVDYTFKSYSIDINKDNCYYLFSDGYADQFGGPKGKKFMVKKLKELFVSISSKSLNQQKNQLETTLVNWMGNHEQVDDILIIGFKV